MIKKILVPVDGSAHSLKAVELAGDLATKYDAEVVLLHVLLRGHMSEGLRKALEVELGTEPRRGGGHLVNMPQQIMARVRDKKNNQLSLETLEVIGKYVLSKVTALCQEKGVEKVTQAVEEGDPAKTILELAASDGIDLIVIGSRGHSDLRDLVVGSVSQKVAQLSKCPCLIVR